MEGPVEGDGEGEGLGLGVGVGDAEGEGDGDGVVAGVGVGLGEGAGALREFCGSLGVRKTKSLRLSPESCRLPMSPGLRS